MRIGEEGDTRKYRRLRKSDYYVAKSGVEAEQVTKYPKCANCGRVITGTNFNGYCLYCYT